MEVYGHPCHNQNNGLLCIIAFAFDQKQIMKRMVLSKKIWYHEREPQQEHSGANVYVVPSSEEL